MINSIVKHQCHDSFFIAILSAEIYIYIGLFSNQSITVGKKVIIHLGKQELITVHLYKNNRIINRLLDQQEIHKYYELACFFSSHLVGLEK
jgi:hypothetical protein